MGDKDDEIGKIDLKLGGIPVCPPDTDLTPTRPRSAPPRTGRAALQASTAPAQ
jgi:hypothetical protein